MFLPSEEINAMEENYKENAATIKTIILSLCFFYKNDNR